MRTDVSWEAPKPKRLRPTCSFQPKTGELEKLVGASSLAVGEFAAAALPIGTRPIAGDSLPTSSGAVEGAGQPIKGVALPGPAPTSKSFAPSKFVTAISHAVGTPQLPRTELISSRSATPAPAVGGLIRPLSLAPSAPPVLLAAPPAAQPLNAAASAGGGGAGYSTPPIVSGPAVGGALAAPDADAAAAQVPPVFLAPAGGNPGAAGGAAVGSTPAPAASGHGGAPAAPARNATAHPVAAATRHVTNPGHARATGGTPMSPHGVPTPMHPTGGIPLANGYVGTGGTFGAASAPRPLASTSGHRATGLVVGPTSFPTVSAYGAPGGSGGGSGTGTGTGTGTSLFTGSGSGTGTGPGTGTVSGTGAATVSSSGSPSGTASAVGSYSFTYTSPVIQTSGGATSGGTTTTYKGPFFIKGNGNNMIGGKADFALPGGAQQFSDITWSSSGDPKMYDSQTIPDPSQDELKFVNPDYKISDQRTPAVSFNWGETPGIETLTATAHPWVDGHKDPKAEKATLQVHVGEPGLSGKVNYAKGASVGKRADGFRLIYRDPIRNPPAPTVFIPGTDWGLLKPQLSGSGTFLMVQTITSGTISVSNGQRTGSGFRGAPPIFTPAKFPLVDVRLIDQVPFYPPGTSDSPSCPLILFGKSTMDESFTDFIMFKPTGQGSIWVPEGQFTWRINTSATWIGTRAAPNWSINPGSAGVVSDPNVNHTVWPTWMGVSAKYRFNQ